MIFLQCLAAFFVGIVLSLAIGYAWAYYRDWKRKKEQEKFYKAVIDLSMAAYKVMTKRKIQEALKARDN